MKAYAGSTSVASISTHPYPRYVVQVNCQLHALAALLPWKEPLYPFHRSLDETRAGLDVYENRKIYCFWRHSNPYPMRYPGCIAWQMFGFLHSVQTARGT